MDFSNCVAVHKTRCFTTKAACYVRSYIDWFELTLWMSNTAVLSTHEQHAPTTGSCDHRCKQRHRKTGSHWLGQERISWYVAPWVIAQRSHMYSGCKRQNHIGCFSYTCKRISAKSKFSEKHGQYRCSWDYGTRGFSYSSTMQYPRSCEY